MRIIEAASRLSEELRELAEVVSIVDEQLTIDLSYLNLLKRHPIFKQLNDRPELVGVQIGQSQVESAIAIATRQHLEQAGAIISGGVDLEAVRRYYQGSIDDGKGRRMQYIF